MSNTTYIWKRALRQLMVNGLRVSPLSAGAAWRGSANRELLGFQTVIPMRQPVVLSPARKLGFKFLAAEAAWICSGDNRVATIAPYAKKIADLSDDGVRFFGAYGPKIIEQLSFVVETLIRDPASRQAVINIWREQPRTSKDTPCTLSLQFLLRGGELHCVASMRSSDIWTGWVYDIFNFSMISAVVALELRATWKRREEPRPREIVAGGTDIQLGELHLTTGSQHLYDVDVDSAQACLMETDERHVEPLDLNDFASASSLIDHLWYSARGDWILSESEFLGELYK